MTFMIGGTIGLAALAGGITVWLSGPVARLRSKLRRFDPRGQW